MLLIIVVCWSSSCICVFIQRITQKKSYTFMMLGEYNESMSIKSDIFCGGECKCVCVQRCRKPASRENTTCRFSKVVSEFGHDCHTHTHTHTHPFTPKAEERFAWLLTICMHKRDDCGTGWRVLCLSCDTFGVAMYTRKEDERTAIMYSLDRSAISIFM